MLDEGDSLFDKTTHCPVCEHIFKARTVKVNAPRILNKDSDFFIRYKTINCYFYDVLICQQCGYAALKIDFDKIRGKQKELVLSSITPKWNEKQYTDLYDIDIAIERYKLALITAATIMKKPSTVAMICLKIAWMYRLKEDKSYEDMFLRKALDNFEDAYLNEKLPVYGMQKSTLLFLLGELHRRLGNNSVALKNFSLVLIDNSSPYRLKELTRDLRNLMKKEKEASCEGI